MKHYYYVVWVAVVLLVASCAAKKIVDPAIGAWEYTVSGTPNGDYSGIMYIAKEGEMYTGKLTGDTGELSLDDVKIESGKMTCSFSAQGYELDMEGTFEGESFTGDVLFDAYTKFPVKATKKTEN